MHHRVLLVWYSLVELVVLLDLLMLEMMEIMERVVLQEMRAILVILEQ